MRCAANLATQQGISEERRADMDRERALVPLERIERSIYLIRGRRVMLDSDLAEIYGVSTARLNEQVRRNPERFPTDFAFPLTHQEFRILISQTAISRLHGGRRKLPRVFTEHGAIMAATVLNAPRAVETSVFVVRAFVRMRKILNANKQFAGKLAELERRLATHDTAIREIVEAIRELTTLPEDPKPETPKIGFRVGELRVRYGKRR
jgi:hypothetical protein